MYVVHSDWLLFHCDAYLSSFCDVKKEFGYVRVGFCVEVFVTNLVGEILASRHVVRGSSVLRRADSNSITRIAIAVSCSLASIGASSSGTAVVGISWEYSVIFS